MKTNIDFRENEERIDVDFDTNGKPLGVYFNGMQPVTMPTDQDYKPDSQMPQSGKAVAQAIAAVPREVHNITSIDDTYETVGSLPSGVGNGTTYLVNENQSLYAYNGTAWEFKAKLKAHTLYCVLTGEKSGIYRYTMAKPYLLLAEQAAVEKAKEYTDAEVKKLLEDYPPEDGKDGQDGKDGVSPTVSISQIANGHKVTITDVSGTKTFDVLDGEKGEQGVPGVAGKDGRNGVDGKDGKTPYIQNKYWYIDGKNTGTRAEGVNGADGKNGTDGTNGKDGVDGTSPHIQGGYWYIGTQNTGVKAEGTDGKDGEDGYTPVKGVDYWTPTDIAEIDSHIEQKVTPLSEGLTKLDEDMQDVADAFAVVVGTMYGEDYDGENVPPSIREIAQDVVNVEGIPEIKQTAEQAYETAGSALGDVQTLFTVDLPQVWEAIDGTCTKEEANQQFSNAATAHLEGTSVAITDISPIQHGVRVWDKANPDMPVLVYVSENKWDSKAENEQYTTVEVVDGIVRVKPTRFDGGGIYAKIFEFTAPTSGTYHFSCDFYHTGTVTSERPNEILFLRNGDITEIIKLTNGANTTYTLKNVTAGTTVRGNFYPSVLNAVISVDYVATFSNIFIGESAMEVEVEAGGTVPSRYPGMAIIAENTSTTLCVEYNRDINKVVSGLKTYMEHLLGVIENGTY